VLQLVERAVVMEKGQVIADGPPDQVLRLQQTRKTQQGKAKPEIKVSNSRSAESV